MNEENNIQNLEEKRRQKAKSFTLNIQDDIYDESAKTENNEPEELNSYSGEDVKEQMAKNSKQALKKKKKIDKKLSKAKNKRNRRVFKSYLVGFRYNCRCYGRYVLCGRH